MSERTMSLGPQERAAVRVLLRGNKELRDYVLLEGFEMQVKDYRAAGEQCTFLIRALLSVCGAAPLRLDRARSLDSQNRALLWAALGIFLGA